MKNEFKPELIEKAKAAKSAAELITIAKENNVEITNEEAASYFVRLNPQSGDVSDEELRNVAGGGCYNDDGRLIVTAGYECNNWSCVHCGQPYSAHQHFKSNCMNCSSMRCQNGTPTVMSCGNCGYCIASGAYIVCTHPANHT